MKFDVIVGNPPYGKNSALAIQFLNLASLLSNRIYFVLPRTFRKPTAINRLRDKLHLVSDHHVDDQVFPGSIVTCWQMWQVLDEPREHIATVTQHEDFQFVTKAEAHCALGRVGGGPCGKIFTEDFAWRSENTHYFLRVRSPEVIERLRSLQAQFRERAHQTVGNPSLSKNDLITIYDTKSML